ncbi:MAG: ATP-binding cassette domain-containing protein [Geminicoccaceae bacterium]
MARVTIDRMSKDYGAVRAVNGLALEIADGELLTLLGPSGCGKSTALSCIAGLEHARDCPGTIRFDDQDVTELEPHQRNVAMVFQDYALYPHADVRDNISFGLKQQKVDPGRDHATGRGRRPAMLDRLLPRPPAGRAQRRPAPRGRGAGRSFAIRRCS